MRGGALQVVNIICHPQFIEEYNELLSLLKELDVKINYYILYADLSSYNISAKWLSLCNIVVIYEKEELKQIQSNYDVLYIIADENDMSFVMDNSLINQISIAPVYNKENYKFFEKNIFTTKSELLTMDLTKKDIFTRMKINPNFFGKLIVLPSGAVYSNLNDSALGTIDDSLYDILIKELDSNRAWRKIRDEEPCTNCRFKWICPPISNYEFVFNAYDLCSIEDAER